MSKKPLPKIKRKIRISRKHAAGVYGWELGSIAFGDPMENIGKKAKTREQARIRWKQQGNKKRSYKSSKADFHKKHG